MQVGLNAGAVAVWNWRLSTRSRSVANLVRSQITLSVHLILFAARSPRCSASRGCVCQRQPILMVIGLRNVVQLAMHPSVSDARIRKHSVVLLFACCVIMHEVCESKVSKVTRI